MGSDVNGLDVVARRVNFWFGLEMRFLPLVCIGC